jgi:hypothetical protein
LASQILLICGDSEIDTGNFHGGWPGWVYATWLSRNHAAKKDERQFYLAISHLAIYIGYQPDQPNANPGFPAAPAIAPGVSCSR